jgi:hypothetical protein
VSNRNENEFRLEISKVAHGDPKLDLTLTPTITTMWYCQAEYYDEILEENFKT